MLLLLEKEMVLLGSLRGVVYTGAADTISNNNEIPSAYALFLLVQSHPPEIQES